MHQLAENNMNGIIAKNLLSNRTCRNCCHNYNNKCRKDRLIYGPHEPYAAYPEEETCINWEQINILNHEIFLENEDEKMAKNMLLDRSCMNCDWLRGHDMKCQKRVILPSYEYGELPEERICNYWKERYS